MSRHVGGWPLARCLAVGANGSVWASRDAAVKLVGDRGSADAEIAALRAVRHAGVVQLLDVVADAAATAIVLSPLAVGDLSRVPRSSLAGPAVAAIGIALAESVEAVHAAGYLHRDIHPGNVLMIDGGGVLLGDFGASACRDATPTAGPRTPGWVAPEVDAGGEADGATDVWAVASVCRSLLAPGAPTPIGAILDAAAVRNPRERPGPAELAAELRVHARGPHGLPPAALAARKAGGAVSPAPGEASRSPRRPRTRRFGPAPGAPARREGRG